MKKRLAAALALVLLVMLFVPAQAVECQYEITQAFVDYLDTQGVKYRWEGVDQDGDEHIRISFGGKNMDPIVTDWYFDNARGRVVVRSWNVIDYSISDYYYVSAALDEANGTYLFVKFYTDDTDNSVTAGYDMPVTGSQDAEQCYEILMRMINILDDVYPQLSKYDITD